MPFSIGVDTGGTFTDVSIMNEAGEVTVHKAFTTPDDPIRGILEGVAIGAADLGLTVADLLAQTDFFVYGTTFATNVIVQRARDGRTGLLMTRGFGDTLAIRRMMRRSTFDIQEEYPVPLVPRSLTVEVSERVEASGRVRAPVDLDAALAGVERLIARGCDAVAICCLHAYVNASHEVALKRAIANRWPELYVTASHEVAPEIREYERTSTVTMNAYVGPAVANHLHTVSSGLRERGLRSAPLIMQSNGGVMSVAEAVRKPVNMLFSGPAGGLAAAAHVGGLVGAPNVIAMDMGGTSFDVGLVVDGQVVASSHGEVDRWPVLGQRYDVHSIGAGGGSIARVDMNGLIKVGPQSAGSHPGPACYGRGGEQPTVTDADVILGYVDPGHFVGGRIPLDREQALRAVRTHICAHTALDEVEAAAAIYAIINARMVDAIRLVTVKKGRDPREFTGVAFGGAGPVHAAAICADLGIRQWVVPALATGLSSFGLLVSDLRHSFAQTLKSELEALSLDEANGILAQMESEALALLRAEGVPAASMQVRVSLDMSYQGQLHEITVPLSKSRLDAGVLQEASAAFARLYRQRYGFAEEFSRVQVVTLRLDGVGLMPHPTLRAYAGEGEAAVARKGERHIFFQAAGGFVPTAVYDGARLRPGMAVQGPAVIEYPGTNLVLLPGQSAVCDPWLNMVVRSEG